MPTPPSDASRRPSKPPSSGSATAGACSSSRRCSTGPRRFNELGEAVPGIAPNILTDRLRRLERERIVVATPYQQRPPRMSYALTADGRDLASALRLLADWGARRAGEAEPDPPRPLRHAARDALVLPDLRGRRRRPRRGRGADRLDRASAAPGASPGTLATMDDERWEPGMPVLDRRRSGRIARRSALPPSLQGLPPRSVPEVAPTPLQRHYVNLSVIVLICGAIAITALELGCRSAARWSSCASLIAAPLLVVTTADAVLRIWRSAWAWMPVDRTKGLFRLAWVVVSLVGLAALVAGRAPGHPRVTRRGAP